MSLCEYAFYKDDENFYPHLYCKTDDKWCHYVKRCEKVEKFIPIRDNIWEECGKYIMEKRKNIPKGSYFIQTIRKNKQGKLFLYVLIEDNKIEKIFSNLNEIKQNYIYLRKTNGIYETSLVPFAEEKTETKKDNIIIHINEELVTEKKRGRKKKTEKVMADE
jgi:hypothetical protein